MFQRFAGLRELLFSRGVILVEGEADVIAYGSWLDSKLRDWDVQLYTPQGDKGFGNHVLFLRSFAIPWAVICDGKAIGDRGACRIALQLKRAGVPAPDPMALKDLGFGERRDALAQYGVFTLAKSAADELEDFERFKEHMAEAERHVGGTWRENKVRIAHFIVNRDPSCPTEVRDGFQQAVGFLRLNESTTDSLPDG